MTIKKIYDISLPLEIGMISYPGNPEFRVSPVKTPHTFISDITMSSHAGTHLDAPRHVFPDGIGAGEIPLGKCIGPCRVLDMTAVKEKIALDDLAPHRIRKGERILFKTQNSLRGFARFYDDYIFLDGDAAEFLIRRGVVLVGIDALSIRQRGALDQRPHTALLEKNIVIFEGLDLSRVPPGRYFFIGPPLKLAGLDGAPARAVLLKA